MMLLPILLKLVSLTQHTYSYHPTIFPTVALTMNINQMAVDNPYGVKAVSDKDAALMRAYTPACVALIDGCQDVPEVRMLPWFR